MNHSLKHLWIDVEFLIVTGIAPCFWFGLWWVNNSEINLYWPLIMPLLFIKLVAVYPILEEWVFRGLLQEYVSI